MIVHFQTSMSVLLTLMAVAKSVPTLMGHLCVAAIVDTLWIATEGPVVVRSFYRLLTCAIEVAFSFRYR